MKLKNKHISEQIAILFILIGAILIIGAIISLEFEANTFSIGHSLGEFGEFIGGFVGSIWALAGVLLYYSALVNQRSEIEDQKELLAIQTDALVIQSRELEKQNKTLQIQKLEDTFFELLSFQSEVVNNLTIEVFETNLKTGEREKKKYQGRRVFSEYFDVYKRFYHKYLDHLSDTGDDEQNLRDLIDTSYQLFYNEYQSEIGHYFRNFTNIIAYLDKLESKKKSFYLNILHSQLSQYELALLFFHGLWKENLILRKLFERYSFLRNIPGDDVILLNKHLYHSDAYKQVLTIETDKIHEDNDDEDLDNVSI